MSLALLVRATERLVSLLERAPMLDLVLVLVVVMVVVRLNCPDRWSNNMLETVVVTSEVISILNWVLVDSLRPAQVREVTRNDIAKLTL